MAIKQVLKNINSYLDTREYDVQFDDGSYEPILGNLIAEQIYASVDKEGNKHQMIKDSIGH